MLDGTLDVIATSTEMYLCTAEPTDRANAIATSVIPAVVMAPSDFNKSNGINPDGRRTTVAAKNGLTANATGDANHVALSTASALTVVTTTPQQTVTSGNTVNIGNWDFEVGDPT